VGVALYLALQSLPLTGYLVIVAVLFGVGVWLCQQTAISLGVQDDPAIVWDEIVGYLITMIGAPAGYGWIALGFLLFRVFDVTKPWPVGMVDNKIKGGVGIMLDDALAGLYACIILVLF
jgi:phosphatidylglycerophosphatase A